MAGLLRRIIRKPLLWWTLAVLAVVLALVCYWHRPLKAPNDPSRQVLIPAQETALAPSEASEGAPDAAVPVQKRPLRKRNQHVPRRTVSGVVLNPDGSRAPGATVQAYHLRFSLIADFGPQDEQRLFKTTTNERGAFALPGLPRGLHAVSAQGEDSSCVEWIDVRGSGREPVLILRMTPACTVSGAVIDQTGNPVSEAQVWLMQGRTSRENEFKGSGASRSSVIPDFVPLGEPVVSDDNGTFTIPFAAKASSRLIVSKAGYADVQTEAFAAPDDMVTVTLGPRGQLAGTVVDDETGEGISGITLLALDENCVKSVTAVSDHAGNFLFPAMRPALYQFHCDDAQYALPHLDGFPVRIHGDERLEGIQLRLLSTVSVSGRVLNAQSGAPLSGIHVRCIDARGVTDENGRYQLDHVIPGTRFVRLSGLNVSILSASSPMLSQHIVVWPGLGSEDVDFNVDPGPVLRGRTVDERGRPVPHVTVYVEGPCVDPAESDADGVFAVTGIEPGGECTVRAQKADLVCVHETPIEIPSQGDPPGFTLILREGGTASGRALHADGSPIRNVTIILGGEPPQRTTAGADGSFLFTGVSEGKHRITFGALGPLADPEAQKHAGLTFRREAQEDVTGLPLFLPEYDHHSSWLASLKRCPESTPRSAIRGLVVDSKGRPVPNVLALAMASHGLAGAATTLHDGTFRMDNLTPGLYALDLSLAGADFPRRKHTGEGQRKKTVPAGLWPVVFRLQRRGQLSGQVFDKATGEPIERFEIATWGFADFSTPPNFSTPTGQPFVDEEGRFSAVNEAPAYEPDPMPHGYSHPDTLLHAFAEGYAPGTVNLGKATGSADIDEIMFYLEPQGVIEGMVKHKDGSPLPRAVVGFVPEDSRHVRELTRTTAEGRYRIEGMGHAEITLEASHPVGLAQREDVITAPGETTRVDFVILNGGTVEGYIASDGQPVEEMEAAVSGKGLLQTASTDAEGHYVFEHLPPGSYTVTAPHLSRDETPSGPTWRQTFEVKEDTVVRADFEMASTSTSVLSGTVTDSGKPITGGAVHLQIVSGDRQYSAGCAVDAEGRYRFEGFPAGTAYVSYHAQNDTEASYARLRLIRGRRPREQADFPGVDSTHILELEAGSRTAHDVDCGKTARVMGLITGLKEGESAYVNVLHSNLDLDMLLSKHIWHTIGMRHAGKCVSSGGDFNLRVSPGISFFLVTARKRNSSGRAWGSVRVTYQRIEVSEDQENYVVLSLR